MSLGDAVVLLLATVGVLLLLVSAIGMVRMQGVHQRMQAASVATALGITLLLLSAGVHFYASAEFGLMLLLIVFFFVTSPIATTAMARAAYRQQPKATHKYLIHDDMAGPDFVADYADPASGPAAPAAAAAAPSSAPHAAPPSAPEEPPHAA